MDRLFDFQKFMRRRELKQREIADILGISVGVAGHWAVGRAFPKFEKIPDLIRAGMTAQELFGEDTAKILLENSKQQNLDPNFQQGVKEMLEEILKEKFSK